MPYVLVVFTFTFVRIIRTLCILEYLHYVQYPLYSELYITGEFKNLARSEKELPADAGLGPTVVAP